MRTVVSVGVGEFSMVSVGGTIVFVGWTVSEGISVGVKVGVKVGLMVGVFEGTSVGVLVGV
jgi:hypothetical protein